MEMSGKSYLDDPPSSLDLSLAEDARTKDIGEAKLFFSPRQFLSITTWHNLSNEFFK